MKIKHLVSDEIINFLYENYDSEQGVNLDKYFNQRHPRGSGEASNNDLNGDFVGEIQFFFPNQSNKPFKVYKNPMTLKGYDDDCRGVLLANGTLFVVDNADVAHRAIIKFLEKRNVIPSDGYADDYADVFPQEFICVQRWSSNNVMVLSSAYRRDRIPELYKEIMTNASKRGGINYVPTIHMYEGVNENELMDITNIMSYRPDGFDSGIVNEEDDFNWELYEMRDDVQNKLFQEFLFENNPTFTKEVKWYYLNENLIRSIWEYYIKFKEVRNEKGMDLIERIMTINVLKISILSYLEGRSPANPDGDFDEAFDYYIDEYFENGTSYNENLTAFMQSLIEENLSEEENKLAIKNQLKENFWWYFDGGHVSDYGTRPLEILLDELHKKTTNEEKLVVIDKMLNVIHQTSDLADNFIRGGSSALTRISDYQVDDGSGWGSTKSVISGKYNLGDYPYR